MVLKYLKEHAYVFLFCLIGGAVMPLFSCSSCRENLGLYFQISLFIFVIWIVQWLGNEGLSHGLDRLISWTERPALRLLAGIAGMIVFTVGAVWLVSWMFIWLSDVNIGDMSVMIYSAIAITAIITTILTSRAFFLNWRQLSINAEKLERENIQARYEALRNQVNPHFLFNSLNALTNLIHEDQTRAVHFVQQLSQVYRYLLDTRDREVVPLKTEIEFLKAYVYLQEIRFGNKLKVNIQVNEESGGVAPLSLQLLVENAIKHNVVSQEQPLMIRVYQEGQTLVVENSLQLRDVPATGSSGVGLQNIRKRYQFLHSQPVEVVSDSGRFVVRLPILEVV